MGQVHADIELLNGDDFGDARRNKIGEDEIRRFPVRALVDSGADNMCINEAIQEVLQLPVTGNQKFILANGEIVSCDVVESLTIRYKSKRCTCHAVVLPGNSEVLLGLLPLEAMDVIIHPKNMELIENPDMGRL